VETAIKHPQVPEQKIIVAVAKIIYGEERRGGVAAIEQPPQDGNEAYPPRRGSEVQYWERETAGKE
jgi:hypothetical protein